MDKFDDDGAGDDGGSGAWKCYVRMESLYEKLENLSYHQEFLVKARIRPIHRVYFMTSINPGEQFYNFACIAAWLLDKCKYPMDMPKESDDPNNVINQILQNVKQLGGSVDFPASKVKSGFGPDVVNTLHFLADKALESKHFKTKPVTFNDHKDNLEEDDDLDAEVNLDKIEEEMDQMYTQSDEEDNNDIAWVQQQQQMAGNQNSNFLQSSASGDQEGHKMLQSDTDAEMWRLEVERVLPQLRITIKTDAHDWRWRQEEMNQHAGKVSSMRDQIQKPLQHLVNEATSLSEKVQNREKYLNSQFASLLSELSHAHEQIMMTKEDLKTKSNEIAAKNKTLMHLSDELDQTRQELDDRGSIMADGAPVVAARKALHSLKKELGDMEVEIGVMEHCLLKSLVQDQLILRDKANKQF